MSDNPIIIKPGVLIAIGKITYIVVNIVGRDAVLADRYNMHGDKKRFSLDYLRTQIMEGVYELK